MADPKDKKENEEPTFPHVAIRTAGIGSKKDGKPKRVINKGDKLQLTKSEERIYRLNKIIK